MLKRLAWMPQAFLFSFGKYVFAVLPTLANTAAHCGLPGGSDACLMSPLTPIGSFGLLLPDSTGSKKIKIKIWICFLTTNLLPFKFKSLKFEREKVRLITFQVLFVKGPPLSKCFLWALYQMDTWNKSNRSEKCSLCQLMILFLSTS